MGRIRFLWQEKVLRRTILTSYATLRQTCRRLWMGCSTTRAQIYARRPPRGGRRCFGPQSAVPAPPLTGARQRTPILPTTAARSLSNPNSRLVIYTHTHTQWQPLQFDIGPIYQPFKKSSNLTPWMGSLYVSYRTLADLLLNPSGM